MLKTWMLLLLTGVLLLIVAGMVAYGLILWDAFWTLWRIIC